MKYTKRQIMVVILGAVAVIIIATLVCFVFFFNPQRTFTIIETYRITSQSGSETYLNVCLPVSNGYQEITDLRVEGVDDFSVGNYDGWDELTAKIPSSDSEVLVTILYTAKLVRNAKPWDEEVLDSYTEPQQYVDSDNEAIIKLGQQLRGDSDYQTAQNILKHVNKLIRSPSGEQMNTVQLTASELLENPVGVCGDKAILMTALLRSDGIPTRMISDLMLQVPLRKTSDWSHSGDTHAWVEFFVNGKWHFADPTWDIFDRSDTRHLSYGTYEANGQSDFQQNRYNTIEESGFIIKGAMSGPLMFTVYSTDENATVIPRGEVSFSWAR